jgi:hypothetical protein
MPSEDEIRQSQPPPDAAIQKLLADIPDFDPRRRQIEEFQEKWRRMPPEPDKNQEPGRCPICGTSLSPAGNCPRCLNLIP